MTLFKVVWLLSGFFKVGILKLPYFLGGYRVLRCVHYWAEQRALRVCRSEMPEGATQDLPIPEYDWVSGTPDEFWRRFVQRPHPVILRGFAKETEAARTWTFDHFMERFGEDDVLLTRPELDGFLGKLKEVRDPDIYLHNCESLLIKYPSLLEQLQLTRLSQWIRKGLGHAQLFVGSRGTGSPFHNAATWNLFTMVEGEKTWWFVDPRHSPFLYPLGTVGKVAGVAMVRYPSEASPKLHPLFKWCPVFKATLKPGDVLLNPPWWWHCIHNDTSSSIAVASRWHGDGHVGAGLQMTNEDDNVFRHADLAFYAFPFRALPFLYQITQKASPMFDEHSTLREKNGHIFHIQNKLVKQGWLF